MQHCFHVLHCKPCALALDIFSLQLREIKNARLAMVAFVGFTIQVRDPSRDLRQ